MTEPAASFRSHRTLRAWTLLFLVVTAVRFAHASAPSVVVSVKPVHALAAALMAGAGEPTLLVRDDAPPWSYRADAKDLTVLEQADLIVWVGPELESGLASQLSSLAVQGRIIELLGTGRLKVLPSRNEEQARDPWLWLDTRNMLLLLDDMTRALSSLDPARTHLYERNRQGLLARLTRLDSEMEYAYKSISDTPALLYHDTQQYFEQAYALNVAAYAAAPGTGAPAAAALLELKHLLAAQPDACLFVEAGLPSPNLDLLTSGPAVRVVKLTSLGQGLEPGPELYERLIRANFAAFRSCAELSAPAPATDADGAELPPHRLETRYLLEDQNGVAVTNLDFPDHYQLIYFGYTYCPDICPTSLAVAAQALKLLRAKAERIQPIFITVDPARDTAEVLRRYTAYFHPRLLGLRGSEAMIARVAAGFRARYEKVPSDTDPSRYSMDHTASLFLLGPDGAFRAKFAHGIPPDELARRLDEIIPEMPR